MVRIRSPTPATFGMFFISVSWQPSNSTSRGSTSCPSICACTRKLRWFSPANRHCSFPFSTCNAFSASACIFTGTLHRPMHFTFVFFSTASVTSPEGFVKFISHASGHSSSMSRAISSALGIVRIAFINPPAPVVSCPTSPSSMPVCSSTARARQMPTRIWLITKSAPFSASRQSIVSRMRTG